MRLAAPEAHSMSGQSGTAAERRNYFLDKADDADKSAALIKDPQSQLHWKKIADGYRELAAATGTRP